MIFYGALFLVCLLQQSVSAQAAIFSSCARQARRSLDLARLRRRRSRLRRSRVYQRSRLHQTAYVFLRLCEPRRVRTQSLAQRLLTGCAHKVEWRERGEK